MRRIRVFVGSPGDVAQERERLGNVVRELDRSMADYFGIELELREWSEVAPDMGRPQGVILSQLPVETWDVFVGILWLRFGTRSGASDPATGKPYESGTEEEFKLAHEAWKATRRPRIMFYRASRPPPDVTRLDAAQLQRVSAFFDQFEVTGTHPGLYSKYQAPEDFERQVREHLTRFLIDQHKASEERPPRPVARPPAPSPGAHGFHNPFIVGRPITDPADFHGRKRELDYLLARIKTGQSCSVVGEGRIGKTSVLHQVLHRAPAEAGAHYRPVFVDLLSPAARTLGGLLRELQGQLGVDEPAETLAGFEKKLDALRRQGVCPLLALDELDLFVRLPGEFSQDFCEALRAAASQVRLVLITASRLSLHELHERGALVSPLFNIMGTKKIGLFTEDEAREFVEKERPKVRFDEEVRRAILQRGNRHPLRLQAYAWHAAQAIRDGGTDKEEVWKEAEIEVEAMLHRERTGKPV